MTKLRKHILQIKNINKKKNRILSLQMFFCLRRIISITDSEQIVAIYVALTYKFQKFGGRDTLVTDFGKKLFI